MVDSYCSRNTNGNAGCLRRLALAVVAILMCFVSSEAKVYLVSVGISDYPGTVNDLRLPANDAKTIRDLYSLNTEISSRLLTDRQATRANIISTMQSLYSQAGPSDLVVFFFSGHGYKGGFAAYDGRLPYSEIRNAMAKGRSNNKMIFADACFAGKLREEKKVSSSEDNDAKSSNVLLFLSSRSNEKSLERRNMKNGMFTAYLDKGLRGHADFDHDRVITAKELFNFVSKNVIAATNNRQHPVMWGKFSDSMPVMQW